ncbi:MAG TPA: hypothetical protein VN132_15860 [Bdellovibrio sp.]|nr:hypothetical protein [Bdellovibrio sp.]
MKLFFMIAIFLPVSAFAICPELTGQYDCQSQQIYKGLDTVAVSIQIKKATAGYAVSKNLVGTHIDSKTDKYVKGPYRSDMSLALGESQRELIDSEGYSLGTSSMNISCSEDGYKVKLDFISSGGRGLDMHSLEMYSLENNGDLAFTTSDMDLDSHLPGMPSTIICIKK